MSQLGDVPLRFQLLVYPVTDARCNTGSYEEFRDGPYLTAAAMHWYLDHYLSGNEGSPDDVRVSPLVADGTGLAASPPTLVITVGSDVLRDEGEAYAARLEEVGVPVKLARYDDMFHGFFAVPELLDTGRQAIADAAEVLRAALDSDPINTGDAS